jgi:hypothetical protein
VIYDAITVAHNLQIHSVHRRIGSKFQNGCS